VVSKAMPWPVGPWEPIRANLVRDFDHKVLAWFFGRRNSIEGNQQECSQYRDLELHVTPPVFGSSITD
jgi:hypothetical protein